jgi:hypothetical protein
MLARRAETVAFINYPRNTYRLHHAPVDAYPSVPWFRVTKIVPVFDFDDVMDCELKLESLWELDRLCALFEK